MGELREDGLRIVPSGAGDAAAVLDPAAFEDREVRHAYGVATRIPEILNQLYCWCGCENRGVHRSNLACFEDEMSASCDVCRGTAEIAYAMVQNGITDAAKIQAAVDARWKPPGA
ncbi:MAG: PCYCGC motif-containing (lipo)protein [Longimicrobiales bacterium]